MTTVSITVTDNGDGTVTMSLPQAMSAENSTAELKYTTDTLQSVMNVMRGWVFQSIPLLKIN